MPIIKHQGRSHVITGVKLDAFSVKLALVELTGLLPREMKLVCKGKTLKGDDEVPADATLMLLHQRPATGASYSIDFHEIITGQRRRDILARAEMSHDDLVQLALRSLNLAAGDEDVCLRFYLPHISMLMRVDLTLADYATALPEGRNLQLYLVPCPRGLRSDKPTSEPQAVARAEEEAAHERWRAQVEAEAEALQLALGRMMALPPSLLETEAAEGAAEPDSARADSAASRAACEEARARAACEAAGVPTRIRTGLMAAPEDLELLHPPSDVLAELAALEEYENDMRDLSAMPYAQARELLVAAEEARFEERCALLVSSLPASLLAADPVAAALSPRQRSPHRSPRPPTTPRTGPGGRGAAGWPAGPRHSRILARSPRASPSMAPSMAPMDLCVSFSAAELIAIEAAAAATASSLGASSCYTASFEGDEAASSAAAVSAIADGLCCAIDDEQLLSASAGRLVLPESVLSDARAAGNSSSSGSGGGTVPSRKRLYCKGCDCRLPLTATCTSVCQCGDLFCGRCMHEHPCSFDRHQRQQRRLKEENPKMTPPKLDRLG